ncbi:SpoIIE family protein phosphatase [Streptomyces dysideae]|uniref:SpoIIE family protein phosphatase n=1 Tax=Streptomyces dysideae TaxID=909626 RepID=UPI000A4C8140|nr:SpoIIE family protein phosphatase [Streptomyces dysideae]
MPVSEVDLSGLSSAYESFLAGGPVEPGVRSGILASWRRCKFFGLEPDRLEIPYQEGVDPEGRLLRAAGPVLEQLESAVSETNVSVILSDERGRVLQRRAGDPKLNKDLDAVQLAVGFTFAEPIAGTNGIGTALADRRPCYILGREHFAQGMEPFACAGAPVRNPLSGHIEGVLDFTCWRTEADPAMLTTVSRAAAEIEKRLAEQATERERELVRAFLRTRHHGRLPVGPPVSGPVTLGVPPTIGEVLDRSDHARLREKAAELISSSHRVTTEVMLSCGQVATLRCRPVTGPSGQMGIAVEARLSGSGLRGRIARTASGTADAGPSAPDSLAVATGRRAPRRSGPPRALPTSSEAPAPAGEGFVPNPKPPPTPAASDRSAPGSGTDEWLLLLGEPGVGRLAVAARRRLALLFDAGTRIGTTLDVRRTAEELAEVAVPQLADFAAVDLMDPVLRGEEPVPAHDELRRVAMSGVREESHLYEVGELVRFVPSAPQARSLAHQESVLEPVLAEAPGWFAQDPVRCAKIVGSGIHSLITVPMQARGVLLGVVSFLRSQSPDPFEDDDLSLAEELVARAALCIDNARRYAREHTLALGLQRSLLPQGLRSQSAVEVAHRYLPSRAGVGGDWYDVIPLSGARVALVVGDVVGHGVHAAATMGRLQTAVHNFSSLDLPADELLSRLDALVDRLDAVQDLAGTGRSVGSGVVGATCLYAVYDPVSRHCVLARAGHPLPALVHPDGTVEFPEVPAGLPLGLGLLPFETMELEISEGSELVLYSDGLIEDRNRDIDVGLKLLQEALAQPARPPEETCDAVLDALLPAHPSDDVALLVARFRSLDADRVTVWDLPRDDPASLCRTRAAVTEQLGRWGLEELEFATELIVSELVANAIRHASGPVQVRLLRDRSLICEVSDGSSTSPRMRQAATTDEDGRGLFMIAQLAARWGTRYTNCGKVIWTEQTLP